MLEYLPLRIDADGLLVKVGRCFPTPWAQANPSHFRSLTIHSSFPN